MKLEVKHLAPYLPYGLNMEIKDPSLPAFNLSRKLELDCGHDFHFHLSNGNVKPVLRPLSELNTEISHEGNTFYPLDMLDYGCISFECTEQDGIFNIYDQDEDIQIDIIDPGNISATSFGTVQKLIEWHFDIFGLIEAGLAIPKV